MDTAGGGPAANGARDVAGRPARRTAAGDRLQHLRRAAGLTQCQVARRAHVSESLLRQVEQGVKPASAALCAAVAPVLGVRVDDLDPRLTPAVELVADLFAVLEQHGHRRPAERVAFDEATAAAVAAVLALVRAFER